MARILHLSDLHFGRVRPELVEPLVAQANALQPDLVAVSGDLTQRARRSEFAAARDLLARLVAPKLVVPGNHDVPLLNLWVRFLRPLRRYYRYMGEEKEPMVRLPGDVAVIGVNSVDRTAHQRGRMDRERTASVARRLSALGRDALKIVVMHHPFIHPPGSDKEPMAGARRAARAFSKAGADIVLSGHLHSWSAEPFRLPGGRALLFLQAGTGLSTRLRGEPNDFNLIDCAPGEASVTRFQAAEDAAFSADPPRRFLDGPEGWVAAGAQEAPARVALP